VSDDFTYVPVPADGWQAVYEQEEAEGVLLKPLICWMVMRYSDDDTEPHVFGYVAHEHGTAPAYEVDGHLGYAKTRRETVEVDQWEDAPDHLEQFQGPNSEQS